MLAQLIYVSTRKASCTEEEIQKILDSCVRNNPPLEITGVLLYNEKKFLQLVEGDYRTLMLTYEKIKNDTRHENCVMISCNAIKAKSFPEWHMGLKKTNHSIEIISDFDAEKNAGFQALITDEDSKALQLVRKLLN